MQYLLDKLTKPEVLPDGTIRTPNWLMLKSAEVIKKISEMGESDKNARLKLQMENEELLKELVQLRQPLDITAYQEAMNADRA